MDSGLTPRRIGRLIRSLDDHIAALRIYIFQEKATGTRGPVNEALTNSPLTFLTDARAEAENLASRLNAGERD